MGEVSLDFLHGLSEEDRLFARRCADRVRAAEEKYRTGFTFFLTEGQAGIARSVAGAFGFGRAMLWGGYEGAERVMLGCFSEYDEPSEESFPIRALTVSCGRQAAITHRDVLGSLMGLDIARETVGDILVGEDKCIIFLTDTAAEEVLRGLTKIGRTGVKTAPGADLTQLPEKEFKKITGTVSSLRADCVLSLAARIPRAKAEQLISQGLMTVRGQTVTKGSRQLAEGDSFSARGYGKFVLETIGGNTKKDRIFIDIKKFV